jgi:hypothetical protein
MAKVFDSSTGFILTMTIYLIVFVSYFWLRKIQDIDPSSNRLSNHIRYPKFIERVVLYTTPIKMTKRRHKIETLLNNTFSKQPMESFYTSKLVVSILTFIAILLVFFAIHQYNKEDILYSPVLPDNYIGSQMAEEDIIISNELAEFDRNILLELDRNSSYEEVFQAVSKRDNIIGGAIDVTANRIYEKHAEYSNEYFKWYELLICLILSIIGYMVPNISLMLQLKVKRYEANNEVNQFRSIILMLMGLERISAYEVIEWLERYAVIFKKPLEQCLSDYEAGVNEAIDEAIDSTNFTSFKKLMRNVKVASNKLSVRNAFEELENEQIHFFNQRKEENEQIIKLKTTMGYGIGLAPLLATIFLYIILPMGIGTFRDMTTIFNQLG